MAKTSLPSYLVRNDYSFCFRIVIPPDLRQIMGRTELRYSLHTVSVAEAKYRTLRIGAKIKELFRKLRKTTDMGENEFDPDVVKRIIKEELDVLLES